jgi:hypothetical protein
VRVAPARRLHQGGRGSAPRPVDGNPIASCRTLRLASSVRGAPGPPVRRRGGARGQHHPGIGPGQALRRGDGAGRLDLEVPEGTVLALLGPNGAGKTTAVRILTTLLDARRGHAEVAGVDVRRNPDGVRERIGLSGQYAAVDEYLTGFENLDMIGRLYKLGRKRLARARPRAAGALLAAATPPTGRSRPTRAACGVASTSRSAGRRSPRCCSWTSRPPARPAQPHRDVGRPARVVTRGHPCCSPRSTWRRRPARRRHRRHRPGAARSHRAAPTSSRRRSAVSGSSSSSTPWSRSRPRAPAARELAVGEVWWRSTAGGWSPRSAGRLDPRRGAAAPGPPPAHVSTSRCVADLDDVFLSLTGHAAEAGTAEELEGSAA